MDSKLTDLEKEIHRLQEKLDKEIAQNRDQIEFISRLSHDIRTPLNSIMGYARLIKETSNDNPKAIEYADNILISGSYMLDMIGEILDMSRIESGSAICKNVMFNIKDCLYDIKSIIDPLVNEKDQTFTISIDRLSHSSIICDENYLKQILINLLSNSCKYTNKGGHIELIARNSGNTMIEFKIKDNGIGMSEEFQKRIFTPFEREQQSTVKDPGGSGLGLSLIKKLVTIMGGNLSFVSKLGQGTTFTVTIPVEIPEDNPLKNSIENTEEGSAENTTGKPVDNAVEKTAKAFIERPLDNKSNNGTYSDLIDPPYHGILKGLKILAAEDNELSAGILTELLSYYGAAVNIAINGRRLIDEYMNSPVGSYDLILMDIMMPEIDGYEAAGIIRSSGHKDAASIPIIAMTANAFDSDIQKALDAGMNAYITKPIDINEIEKAFYKISITTYDAE